MRLKVNGENFIVNAPDDIPLLWVLRDFLNLTGTKYGCGIGVCGSCTVLLDGDPIRSCMTLASEIGDRQILTIEGISDNSNHPVQQAWKKLQVPQCGYCQSGQILTAIALLNENDSPSNEEIDAAMSDVLCRCGTYPRIRDAIELVVNTMHKDAAK